MNTRRFYWAALLLGFVVSLEAASAQDLIYVVDFNSQFGTVNLSTGAFTSIGIPTADSLDSLVWGEDGSLLSLSVSGNLGRINPQTGETTIIGQTGLGYSANVLATLNGKLYATDLSNNLYSVDAATGAATLIGPSGIPPVAQQPFSQNSDGTINLFDEGLYAWGGNLYANFDSFKVDPNTLLVTPWVNPALYEIDPTTGETEKIAPTLLGMSATVVVDGKLCGLESAIIGWNQNGPIVQNQLYSVDLSSGAAHFVRNLDSTEGAIFGAAPVRMRRP